MYGKIFKSIYYGSLATSDDARDLFICLCAHADQDGFVDMNLWSIGNVLRWDEHRLELAANILMSPDPDSGTPDEQGRRILAQSLKARGIHVVNYTKYRAIQSKADEREYQQRYYQERTKPKRHKESSRVNSCQPSSTDSRQGEGEGEVEADTEQQTLPLAGSRRGVARKSLENGEALPEGEITADEAFSEIFWPEYPRKRDREDAFKAWKSLKLRDDDEELIGRIMARLRRDVKEEWRDRSPDKIPYPAHWLRTKGWTD